MYAALIALMLLAATPAPDTLVVCPREFRPALEEWLQYRGQQGYHIAVIPPAGDPARMHAAIRSVNAAGQLKCLVIIGDVPGTEDPAFRNVVTPTNHVTAKVNTRWGSDATIATDIPYADIDGDGGPDLAIGRIPADSPNELRRVLRKVIRYETANQTGDWQRRLDIVAGVGGFGAVADSLIEAAGRVVFQQAVPPHYELRQTSAKTANAQSDEFRDTACNRLNEGSLAWIYLGHGMPTELDRVPTPVGQQPILSVDQMRNIRCEQCRPLAVLVACYTGAFDCRQECLAEELALSDHGPVAVIAATRVTMPYGNTVFGYELLRACFHDRPTSLGEAMRLAQCRTLTAVESDKFRPSLDSMAQGISPPPVNLAAERREHVLMYHLIGDPLLRLRIAEPPQPADAIATPVIGAAVAD
jgi:hypothetical protein